MDCDRVIALKQVIKTITSDGRKGVSVSKGLSGSSSWNQSFVAFILQDSNYVSCINALPI